MTDIHQNRDGISFIILTWNSGSYIEACVASILGDLENSGFRAEVFIVDNGSKDGCRQLVSEMARTHPGLIFPILLDKNYGTTIPRNLALKKANERFICIMDSDIQILPGLLTRLIHTLTQDRVTGLVAPKLVYPDGRLQKSMDQFPTLTRKLYRYFFLKKLEGIEPSCALDAPRPVDYAISALWVFERSLIERIGGLDERIFYAPEDAEFCHRIWKAGLQVIYDPGASAVHNTQEISRGGRFNRAFVHHILGLAYYYVKHKFIFKRPRFHSPPGYFTGNDSQSHFRAALKRQEPDEKRAKKRR